MAQACKFSLPVSAIIPAAGNSGRMGTQKTLLSYGNGTNFTSYLVNFFRDYGCNKTVLIVNEGFNSGVLPACDITTVVNHQLEKGRSWSIHLGLKQVPESSACFIQNIDNPFLEHNLLDELRKSVLPDGYAVPVCHGHGGHPILLGENVVDFLRRNPDVADFRKALQCFTRIEIPYRDERILWNINTPDDYKEFSQWDRS
jgi:CTP:molybdopterin cytidylyltransferase MocA